MEREVVTSCLAGDLQRAGNLLGIAIPAELLDKPTGLQFAQMRLEEDPHYRLWSMRAIVLADTGSMVGHIRFHSRPDPPELQPFARGAVEFGYHIFRDQRRQGYATEAARAAMDWAQSCFGVHQFVVTISPDNQPSLAVARRLGFVRIGEHIDEVDGVEHLFLRDIAA